jgi:capsular polysaccharide biosynthesis protein
VTTRLSATIKRSVHAVTQSHVGKRCIRFARATTIEVLHVARGVEWLRRRLHLPANQTIDLLQHANTGDVRVIELSRGRTFRRALPCLPEDAGALSHFRERTREYPDKEYVAVLEKGSVWGYAHGAVFTSREEFVPTFARDPWGPFLHEVWTRVRLPQPRRVAGRALYLVTAEATDNYHHWLIDLLPRIGAAERAGFPVASFDHVILNHANRAYQWETLQQLGIRREQVVQVNPALRLQPDELVIPSLKKSNEQMPSEHVRYLRRNFLPGKAPSRRRTRRIFLSRKDAPSRRLRNEAAAFELLQGCGFELVCLSGWSITRQAELFAEAEVIAGPSGAAFANLVFANPGTRVIEFASPNWLTVYHWMISARRGLHHSIVLGPGRLPSRELNISGRNADMVIDLDKLERVLATLPPSTGAASLPKAAATSYGRSTPPFFGAGACTP